jgi:hypothetical protein
VYFDETKATIPGMIEAIAKAGFRAKERQKTRND